MDRNIKWEYATVIQGLCMRIFGPNLCNTDIYNSLSRLMQTAWHVLEKIYSILRRGAAPARLQPVQDIAPSIPNRPTHLEISWPVPAPSGLREKVLGHIQLICDFESFEDGLASKFRWIEPHAVDRDGATSDFATVLPIAHRSREPRGTPLPIRGPSGSFHGNAALQCRRSALSGLAFVGCFPLAHSIGEVTSLTWFAFFQHD
jgi:hypothetical protein